MPDADTRGTPLLMLVGVTALGPLALNIFLPSMPRMEAVFDTSYGVIHLTLSLYLAALACSQLVYGPLSDRFGRRPVLLSGLALYIAGALICLAAGSVTMLIVGRVVQAVGGCAGLVIGRAMVRDQFGRDEAASKIATITMVMVLAPMVAPLIGGQLDIMAGWRSVFGFVLAVGVLVAGLAFVFVRETIRVRQPFVSPTGLVPVYARLLGNRAYRGYAFQTMFTAATFYTFVGGAPYLLQTVMGLNPMGYAFWFIGAAACYMAGNFTSARLARAWGVDRLIALGTAILVLGALAHVAFALAGVLTPLAFMVPMYVMTYANGLCIPTGTAASISVDPTRAGAASGLSGFLQMGFGALASFVVGHLLQDDQWPFVVMLVICSLLATAAHWYGQRGAKVAERIDEAPTIAE
ncbi:MAG: multidrug effflux MFS transporter [Azospirillaceae bacterium]